jgi:hypothetical protein
MKFFSSIVQEELCENFTAANKFFTAGQGIKLDVKQQIWEDYVDLTSFGEKRSEIIN